MSSYLESFWGILVEIAPFVLLGMLAAGLVHEALGRFQRLRAFALKRSPWSLSFFNIAGFTLPICSCGVVPLAVGLHQQGVPFGNLFAFVFSAPATSIAAVILSLAVLGPDFTLYYVVGALVCGYAVGAAFYLAERRPTARIQARAVYICEDSEAEGSDRGFLHRALRWGTVTYGSRIAFDLIVGLSLAALLVSTYPVHTIGAWIADLPFWVAAIATMAIAIPLYVCSLPGIMVGGALVLGGFTPGLVWIFLMAGPVTNLGDINVLRRNLGWRSTLLYVGVVVLVTFLWGWVIHTQVQWEDIWGHVREYYGSRSGLGGGPEGDVGTSLAGSSLLGLPREIHYASALLLGFLTLRGAWLTARQLWLNPCLNCRHFQDDVHLNPAICSRPCWKRRLLSLIKPRHMPSRSRAPVEEPLVWVPTKAKKRDYMRDRACHWSPAGTRRRPPELPGLVALGLCLGLQGACGIRDVPAACVEHHTRSEATITSDVAEQALPQLMARRHRGHSLRDRLLGPDSLMQAPSGRTHAGQQRATTSNRSHAECPVCHPRRGSHQERDATSIRERLDESVAQRGQGCSKSAVATPAAVHEGDFAIPLETCLSCHFDPRLASTNGIGDASVHYGARQGGTGRGLLCQDCHTAVDMHAADGTEVRCEDCHGTSERYPWELPLRRDEADSNSATTTRPPEA